MANLWAIRVYDARNPIFISDRSDRNVWSDVSLASAPSFQRRFEVSKDLNRSRIKIDSIDIYHWSSAALNITSTSRRHRDGVVARTSTVRELPRIPKEYGMSVDTGRPNALLGCSSVALGVAALAAGPAHAEAGSSVVPQGAHALPELMERLRKAPRRRDFKTVPMILDHPDLWDDTALKEVIAYRGTPKQVWDNTDIGSPWMNLMRNSLNAQVFS